MKIKVCGMKYAKNISELMKLPIDMMGLIFYSKSPRYVSTSDLPASYSSIQRVGVFVNADLDEIEEKVEQYELDLIQLHGDESPEFCKSLEQRLPVIKALSIAKKEDLEYTKRYEGVCSYFLFDTKTPQYGGSGQKFDWQILDSYRGKIPFLLSGGISEKDVSALKKIQHPMFYGIDLNSCFELEAGLKNISLIEKFIKEIKS